MQRFKAWLFVWLMGEHFAEIARALSEHGSRIYELDKKIMALEQLTARGDPRAANQAVPKKVIQSRNWADFQRLAGDSDQEVQ